MTSLLKAVIALIITCACQLDGGCVDNDVVSGVAVLSNINIHITTPKTILSQNGTVETSMTFELTTDDAVHGTWKPKISMFSDFLYHHIMLYDEHGKEIKSKKRDILDDPMAEDWTLKPQKINDKIKYSYTRTLNIKLSNEYPGIGPGKYHIVIMYDYRLILGDESNPYIDTYKCYTEDLFKFVRSPLLHNTLHVTIQ